MRTMNTIFSLLTLVLLGITAYIIITKLTRIESNTAQDDETHNIDIGTFIGKTNIPMVEVVLEGKIYHFIMDTGSNMSFIDVEIGNLVKRRKYVMSGSGVSTLNGVNEDDKKGHLYDFQINGNYTRIFTALMFDTDFSFNKADFAEYDIKFAGILGNDFLIKNGWNIDINNRLLRIKPPHTNGT